MLPSLDLIDPKSNIKNRLCSVDETELLKLRHLAVLLSAFTASFFTSASFLYSFTFFTSASFSSQLSSQLSLLIAHSALSVHCFHLIVAILNPILDHIADHIADHILDPIFDHILYHYL
ncbi:hypothetical protein FHG87_025819 [Trinorchestia longiramus]|nr:hypothetical protein FHG87_025819 [Trinorchestia longiramus]